MNGALLQIQPLDQVFTMDVFSSLDEFDLWLKNKKTKNQIKNVLVSWRVMIKEVAIQGPYRTQQIVCRCRIKEARMTPCVLHFT